MSNRALDTRSPLSRGDFLCLTGMGFGALVFDALQAEEVAPANPLGLRSSHFGGAKNVIWIVLNGGPSHLDTWDYKPELQKRHGQDLNGGVLPDQRKASRFSLFLEATRPEWDLGFGDLPLYVPARRRHVFRALLLLGFQQS